MTLAWTYSQLDSFETCPKKFFHLKVARDVVEPPTEHQEWGTQVHTAFENAVNSGQALPEKMRQWQPLADKLCALPGKKYTEHRFAIDKAFAPTDWSNAWSRGIADLLVVHGDRAAVLDYKTGKRKPSEQLLLYAAYAYHHFPAIKHVRVGYVWLKDRRVDWQSTAREDLPATWQLLLPRVRKLESAYERASWPARPSGLCRAWCPVVACDFNGKKNK